MSTTHIQASEAVTYEAYTRGSWASLTRPRLPEIAACLTRNGRCLGIEIRVGPFSIDLGVYRDWRLP